MNRYKGQDERIDELRETHQLESRSQVELIDRLRKQIEETEALLKANHGSSSQLEADLAHQKAEHVKFHAEIERLKTLAKDEEEKRSKAITLLKTVRTKQMKAEKERDDAVKELAAVKEKEQADRDKENTERANLQALVDRLKAEKETGMSTLRAQHERELASTKERNDKEMAMAKGQYQHEAATARVCHGWIEGKSITDGISNLD